MASPPFRLSAQNPGPAAFRPFACLRLRPPAPRRLRLPGAPTLPAPSTPRRPSLPVLSTLWRSNLPGAPSLRCPTLPAPQPFRHLVSAPQPFRHLRLPGAPPSRSLPLFALFPVGILSVRSLFGEAKARNGKESQTSISYFTGMVTATLLPRLRPLFFVANTTKNRGFRRFEPSEACKTFCFWLVRYNMGK